MYTTAAAENSATFGARASQRQVLFVVVLINNSKPNRKNIVVLLFRQRIKPNLDKLSCFRPQLRVTVAVVGSEILHHRRRRELTNSATC
jgi:hypothetical protein